MRPKQQRIRRILGEIRKLIADEPKELPLTDGEIAQAVNQRLKLKIRTHSVWYYRQALGIPSSGERRKAYRDGEEKTA